MFRNRPAYFEIAGLFRINILIRNTLLVSGRKLVLAWLNTPRMFERPRVVMGERDVSVDDNRRRRISLRKFRYGNVGASWKALKSETVAKIVPSDEQVAALFPEEEEGDKTLVYSSQGAPDLHIGGGA